ncbi:MAG: methyltransferase domain-containing protein [Clostridia bacterium]|nr:methyltransferase domain-containing protein [Clostridia bacterium]
MMNHIGEFIARRRKEMGYTQQKLAERLNISFQAISKWEVGNTLPDIQLLPQIAAVLNTSVDAIWGHTHVSRTHYEEKYRGEAYYWGIVPNKLCYEIMKLRPPIEPYRVLDIGCGEGKDAVFLAKNGYEVTAFDIAETGLDKAKKLAEYHHVKVDFFRADINEYVPNIPFDIIYSSGVLHYISAKRRALFFEILKANTSVNGIHALNVFVKKPFISEAPDLEDAEKCVDPWHSGELAGYYCDWLFHKNEERIFDCTSGGTPHKHCMDVLIAEKK